MNYKLSRHAHEELLRRNIPSALLDSVMQNPQQIITDPDGKRIYQSQLDFGAGKIFLLRAVVDDTIDPAVVVTVYRTSKISRYWKVL